MSRLRFIIHDSLRCCLIFGMAMLLHPFSHAQAKPLTESQLKDISNGELRSNTQGLLDLIEAHGVDFIPTSTFLASLSIGPEVKQAILEKAGRQMRIRVCKFASDDQALATSFAESMREEVRTRKGVPIPPFRWIPLDDTLGPTEDCEQNGKQGLLYILLEGSMTKTPSRYSLKLHVISLSPSGDKHPIPNSRDVPPQDFTRATLNSKAAEAVDWGIKTLQLYAEQ
jgi:hypothetical protein